MTLREISRRRAPVAGSIDQTWKGPSPACAGDQQALSVEGGAGDAAGGTAPTRRRTAWIGAAGTALAGLMSAVR